MGDPLTRDEVLEIARLARLALTDDEVEQLRVELAAILAHMQALRALDTGGVEPMTHAVPMTLALRADEVEPSLPAETAVAQAPTRDGAFFRVASAIKPAE